MLTALRAAGARLGSRWRRHDAEAAPPSDGLKLALLALVLRLSIVAWAAPRFPPADDGKFYQVVAERIAHGQGYTWLWPDGVVTYAAHYPVGYPALLGAAYALFGSSPTVAMLVNALLGAGAVFAAHRLAAASGGRAAAGLAALLVAVHPGLAFYTPGLMTEGVAAAVVALGAWLTVRAARRAWSSLLLAGLVLGAGILIRPQLLLAVPLIGLLATSPRDGHARRLARAAVVTALAVATCLPWTMRNCARLERCVFVSANGGWNLFIGTAKSGRGGWVPIETIGVPDECRTVFGEADKDRCFGAAGLRRISEAPGSWLALVPAKLMMTFEYSGAAAYYLHVSNGAAFGEGAKNALGVAETAYQRIVLLLALLAAARLAGPNARVRRIIALGCVVCVFLPLAWLAHLGVVTLVALLGAASLRHPSAVTAAAVVLTTALTHAVFFGAGRYGLVTFIPLAALAGLVFGSVAGGQTANDRAALFDRQIAAGDTLSAGDTDAVDRN